MSRCPTQDNFQQDISLNKLNLHPFFNQNSNYLRPYKHSPVMVACGGFSISKTIPGVDVSLVLQPTIYDLTHTFQVQIPSSVFNQRIGIYKDASGNILETSNNYDEENKTFYHNNIVIAFDTFIESFTADDIISLGIFQQLYTDFIGGINRYFRIRGVERQLINELTDSNADGFLSFQEFYDLISSQNNTNNYILQGFINLSDISELLKVVIRNNSFQNRTTENIQHGFIPGDKILVQQGLEIKFQMDYAFPFTVADLSSQYFPTQQPFYSDISVNAIPNLDKTAVGDILFVIT